MKKKLEELESLPESYVPTDAERERYANVAEAERLINRAVIAANFGAWPKEDELQRVEDLLR